MSKISTKCKKSGGEKQKLGIAEYEVAGLGVQKGESDLPCARMLGHVWGDPGVRDVPQMPVRCQASCSTPHLTVINSQITQWGCGGDICSFHCKLKKPKFEHS